MEQAFWEKVDRSAGADGCWPWLGGRNASVYLGGRWCRAHRVIYEQSTGEQLGERVVTARCRNPLCVNPRHLIAVTKRHVQHRRERPNSNNRNSRVKNVYPYRRRWRASVKHNGTTVAIGTFDTVAEAAVSKARARIAVPRDAV